ncbi:MAG TPA: lytic transglycosylase domain-containing protein, partial [Candidatus Deferrimicrobium sp.]|nr:lytic transglycosylase domain-containing protein [Candidatus Deferrimicrobium sp.]
IFSLRWHMAIGLAQKKKLKQFVKRRKGLLLNLGIWAAILYLLFFLPATKITWDRLINLLSERHPPAWMLPEGGSIDVHQTKLYKYQALTQFKIKLNTAGKDLLKTEWSKFNTDIALAGNIFVDFWGTSVITVGDETLIVSAQPDSPPINLNDRVLRWQKDIEASAKKYSLEPALIAAVMEQESGGDPVAGSPVGAIGLMQLMPATAKMLGVNPYDPAQNIDGGAHYLQMQLRAFGSVQAALAAYNAGPGRVEDRTWVNLPETMNYVERVPRLVSKYERIWNEHQQVQGQAQTQTVKKP